MTFRRTISGMKIESENERWLLAMIAGPSSGTYSRPSTCGRKTSRSHGPRTTYFSSQYSTAPSPPVRRRPDTMHSLRIATRQSQTFHPPRHDRTPGSQSPSARSGRVALRLSRCIHGRRYSADEGRGWWVSAGDGRHGRRDNGLTASEYAAAGDVDPRVGEHLLDVLALDGIAAYLRPSSDMNPVTRTNVLPAARPTASTWTGCTCAPPATTSPGSTPVARMPPGAAEPAPPAWHRRPAGGPCQPTTPDIDEAWARIVEGYDRDPATRVRPGPWPRT